MPERLSRVLPWLSAAGLLIATLSVALWSSDLTRARTDTGQTRPIVQRNVEAVLDRHPASATDAAFLGEVERLRSTPHVGTVWLFGADGKVAYASGATAAATPPGANATDLAADETRRVVQALDATLTADQKTAILATSAMLREGEHNDIFRHMLRPITTPEGLTVGFLGVNYAANPALGQPPTAGFVVGLLAFVLGAIAYWCSLPLWVFADARARGERAWVWAAFVLVGNLVALMAYLLTRGQPLHGEPARAVRG
jgi:hypothetical protein